MKAVSVFFVVGAAFAALSGCSVTGTSAGPDSPYSYSNDPKLTFAYSNKAPAEFPPGMSDSEKVRRLFGYPLVAVQPMGTFLATHAMASSQFEVDGFLSGKKVTYGPKGPSVDDFISLGLGAGGIAGAAIAGTAIASAQASGADIRERSSSALCYVDAVKTPSVGDALIQCQNSVEAHMIGVLSGTRRDAGKVMRQISGSVMVNGVQTPEVLYLLKINAAYTTGFAPKDIGGYQAHIFKIEFFPQSWTDKISGTVLAEDLAKALAKDKPVNVFYRVSAAHDYRNRSGLEPIGVY